MNRRDFMQASALAAAGSMMFSSAMAMPDKSKKGSRIGLQLYSLRDVIGNDPKGILKNVADMGYKEVETYGYADGKLFGMPSAEFGKYVSGLGMRIVSGHYGINIVSGDWEKACSDAKEMGQKYVIVPWLDKAYYNTMDTLKKTCETINKGAEVAKKYGLRMGYHNHAFEFEQVEGKVILDTMLEQLDPKLVIMEMDIYWVVFAGQDPMKYFERYPGRFELWHVKDMDKAKRENNADVGTGSIDFKPIFDAAKKSGMKHFFIEQETYPSSSLESVKNCIANLKKIV